MPIDGLLTIMSSVYTRMLRLVLAVLGDLSSHVLVRNNSAEYSLPIIMG
jgi:hypothetical protein